MAIPTNSTALVGFSQNFNDRIVADGVTDYQLTAAQVAGYTPLHQSFIDAQAAVVAARESNIRDSSLVAQRDSAQLALLKYARTLYAFIQKNADVSDANKLLLGVKVVDSEPTPVPPPAYAPGLIVASVDGHVVRILLTDPPNPGSRRIPAGVDGAIVMSYIGETAPMSPSAWNMQGPISKMSTEVVFDSSLEPGTKVWLAAVFFNGRKQMGPACTPVGTQINYPASLPMAS